MQRYTSVVLVLILFGSITSLNVRGQASEFPVDHAYQVTLYNWIASLDLQDVSIPEEPLEWDGTYSSSTELANIWMELTRVNIEAPILPSDVIKGEARWFVLDDGSGGGVIGSGEVRMAENANNAAYWYQRSLPLSNGGDGNPYYKHAGVCNRALVSVAVDMALSDYWHDQNGDNPWGTGVWAKDDPRFLGGLMNYWTYTVRVCNEVVDNDVREAFFSGLTRMAEKLLDRGVNRNTPNMMTRVIPAMANLYVMTEDRSLKDLSLRIARKYMFGLEDGVFQTNQKFPNSLMYPAGYVQEGYGPETTYNGVSLYHLMEARAIAKNESEWDFMDEPLRQMADFRAYQLFEDPDGKVDGPSAYAGRTGASWARLQAPLPWRDITVAGFYTEGHMFMEDIESIDGMISDIKGKLTPTQKINTAFSEANSTEVKPFAIEHGHHWPNYVPYSPRDGWYDDLSTVSKSKPASTHLPYNRSGYYFSRSFADDFWAYKGNSDTNDFGFFLESEADGGTYGGYRGGSLQSFWTDDGGIFILGRKDKDSREWDILDQWGTHHVWGKTPQGNFSTAVEQKRDVQYELGGDSPTVTISGPMDDSDQQVQLDLDIANTFTALSDGLKIEHEIKSNGSVNITELWASIPVYLYDCNPETGKGSQCDIAPTSIQYWDGSEWKTPGNSLISTTKICLGRTFQGGSGYLYIYFDEPQQFKLASPWQQVYQTNARLQNIQISLLDSQGQNQSISSPIKVSYSLSTSESGPGTHPIGNLAPDIDIVFPRNRASFEAPANIQLTVDASDTDGQVIKVEFYQDNSLLHSDSDGSDGWSYDWSNVSEGSYDIHAVAIDNDNAKSFSDNIEIEVTEAQATSSEEDHSLAPTDFALHQNFPNPFTDVTTFTIDIPETTHVNLSIFDLTGRQISELFNGVMEAGKHNLVWNTDHIVNSGVYLFQLQAGDKFFSRKAILMR